MKQTERPVDRAEAALIRAILNKTYAIGEALPGERDLATQIGVTRPTLREALRRLEQDGWLDVQHGKSTRVRNFWQDGGLNVLSSIVRYDDGISSQFVVDLLEVRAQLTPAYTLAAVQNKPEKIKSLLNMRPEVDGRASDYARYDWTLQHQLTIASGNPVYTLILNGFSNFYRELGFLYFGNALAREASQEYYQALIPLIDAEDYDTIFELTSDVMQMSIVFWKETSQQFDGKINLQEIIS